MDLVRQRNNIRLHGGQQDTAVCGAGRTLEHLSHLRRRGHIGNASGLELRVQVAIQWPQGVARHAHHRILVRQPDTTHCLPPQSLFLEDLASTIMNGAVLPHIHKIFNSSLPPILANSITPSVSFQNISLVSGRAVDELRPPPNCRMLLSDWTTCAFYCDLV